MVANTQTDVKVNNQKAILMFLTEHGATSRADIAKGISSSKPTVSKNVEELIEKGLLVEVGKGDNSLGKKSLLLDINKEFAYVLAVDLSKNAIRFRLCDLQGGEEAFMNYQYDTEVSALEMVNNLLSAGKIKRDSIGKVVVAYPGVIAHNGQYYLSAQKERETLRQELLTVLRQTFDCAVIVKNDINLAILAEKAYNEELRTENLYYMSFDAGVGAGIMIHGRLYEGDRNAAGEVGFILRNRSDSGNQKSYQTLEELVSISAILERYKDAAGESAAFDEIADKLCQRDSRTVQLYEAVIEDISVAISNVTSVLDIETVVLDGAVMKLSKDMHRDIEERVNAMSPFHTTVLPAGINTAALRGCNYFGIQLFFEELWK